MDYVDQEPDKPRQKILRQSSLNSVRFPNNSRISKISSQIGSALKSDNKNTKTPVVFKQNQITEQLQKQIAAIEQCIKNYKPFLKHIKEKQQHQTIRQQILSIDSIIISKDKEIKIITQEVKQLKSSNNPVLVKNGNKNNSREEQNYFSADQITKNSNPDLQQNNIFKLADQLKKQREFLLKLQHKHTTKQSRLKQITSKVQQFEQKYVEKCLKSKQKPLRYEEFKELNQQKKQQMEQKVTKQTQKTTSRQKYSSIKQMPLFVFNIDPIKTQKDVTNTVTTKKSLKSLQSRKIIAGQALKNSRKKHNNELTQLMAKLQFLRDQDSLLLQKIREKQEQKVMLQAKFNEQKGGGGSFHLQAHNRFMSPSNRSRENKTNRFESMGLNAKINKLMTPLTPISNSKSIDGYRQHHFSPHRKLISSRKGAYDAQNDQSRGDFSRRFRDQEGNENRAPFYENDLDKFDDYEEKTFNPKSKNSNSNKDPSTNENDSHFEKIN